MTAVPVDEATELTREQAGPARRVTLAYVLTATAILAVSGVLGVLLRDSQADLGRLDDNTWYAVMTVHGLGSFVGWAAFALMGFSFWVLARLGFALRPAGARLAWGAYWAMVVGVVGIVLTTLAFGFGASWVFLYPLPFSSAGQWDTWVAGWFSASALMAGVSIILWCLAILHTIVGPALHAASARIGNRLGVAIGLGYLFPARFATNPRSVPYPVIPLTVIGIDMIVATLPLAVLLVIMIVQTAVPGATVDPLLAKNILWFFGHPVVYLLLFPAVAIYYYLIPVYAGRRLVAGNVIAVAWVIAVIANVVVWAHHVYIDYPENTPQAALNTAMQPLTFALTIPSALSLYSIGFTIWRSRFRWTAASTALFLGAVGWLLAGLSGVVNATIALDRIVHNTLWIVGHFHHMALLNMGLVIFGATYHFLPELTGKALRSEAAAKWHVWLTFLAGTGLFVPWLVQGLQGAPRRFSVLPDGAWDGLTVASVPFVFVLALAQLLFFWNVVQTVRGVSGTVEEAAAGEARRVRRPRRGWQPVTVEAAAVLVAVAIAVGFGVGGWLIGRGQRTEPAPAPAPAPAAPAEPAEAVGRDAFETANCGGCHTLAKAGATGQVGPSLDTTALTEAEIAQVVANGRNTMPAFAGQLTDEQIGAVAAFVAQDP